jgi:hypothetical protein
VTVALVDAAVRCPLGSSVAELAARWLAGETAATLDPTFGLVARCPPSAPGPHVRFLAPQVLPAWDAATELLARVTRPAPERTALFFGYGGLRAPWDELAPALADQRPDGAQAWERGLKNLHPFWMLRNLSNGLPGLLAPAHALLGDGVTTAGPDAGVQALAAAIRSLRAGACDAALVVGADSLLAPEVLLDRATRGVAGVPGAGGAALWLVRGEDAPAAPRVEARARPGPHLDLRPATGELGAATALVELALGAWVLAEGQHLSGGDGPGWCLRRG